MPFKDNPHQGEWRVEMFDTPFAAPCACLFSCMCPCYVAYQHREHIIGENEYYCCGGLFPVCCLKDPCPRNPCLCLEVTLCPFNANMTNRYLIQQEHGLKNNACDECLIWGAVLCSCAICILQVLGSDVDESLVNLVDCFACAVTGCMATQSGIELGLIEYNDYQPIAPEKQDMA